MFLARCFALSLILVAMPLVLADDRSVFDSKLLDTSGKSVAVRDLLGPKATLIAFIDFDCPVSNSYNEALCKLASKDVAVVLVRATNETPAEVKLAAATQKVSAPVYIDEKFTLAKELRASITPEVFLFDGAKTLCYQGRIDGAWSARLRRNVVVRTHDLREALDSVLAGKSVKVSKTTAVGCPIRWEKTKESIEAKITYHRDVAPILQKHCLGCHRSGEVGPFSLTNYREAYRWSDDIKSYTASRQMPPWMPAAGHEFQNDRRLSTKEIDTLAAWVDGGAVEGDPKEAPAPRKFSTEWAKGEPDLILSAETAYEIAASGPDVFRVFVIPTRLKEHRWVIGYDVRPGDARVVHHTLHYFDTTGKARALEQATQEKEAKNPKADRGPGYSVAMGVGFTAPQYRKDELPRFGGLGGWAPGQAPQFVPKGAGWFLPAGADFLLQVHYHRDGKVAKDQTKVGLYFAKGPVEQPWQTVVITGMQPWQSIPAGEANFRSRGTVYLHDDALLHNVMPHMHLLGKSVKVTMTPPATPENKEPKPQTIIDIPAWDYAWQETYWFKKPIVAKAGTKFEVEGVFDNSGKNPNNPNSPPKRVRVGEETNDEMLYAFLGATSTKSPWQVVRFNSSPPRSPKGDAPTKGDTSSIPTDPMKILGMRVGQWDTKTTLPDGTTIESLDTIQWSVGEKFLESVAKVKNSKAESRLLANWDEASKVYRYWYFDSTGLATDGRGSWDAKTKTLTWNSTSGGVQSTTRWRFVSETKFEWDLVSKDAEGTVVLRMNGVSTKRAK